MRAHGASALQAVPPPQHFQLQDVDATGGSSDPFGHI